MTSPASRTVIAAKLVADEFKALEAEAKARVLELSKETGATTFTVKDDDDTKLGTVSVSDGKTSAEITNEAALYQWVKKNRPDQLVEVIAPAYLKALLKAAVESGDGVAVDEDSGEVIPGIEVSVGDPYVSSRPNADAKARMRELVAGSKLLGLAGGGTDGEAA
jgi:predicted metalloendopeptidase